MARRRKSWGCGHRGFGAWCHRCDQAEAKKAEAMRQRGAAGNAMALLREADRLTHGGRRAA